MKKLKIPFTTHRGSSQIVFDDEYGDGAVFWNYNGTQYALFCEDHVISLLTHALETVAFEDAGKQLVWDRAKLWHAWETEARSLAATKRFSVR